MSKVDKKVRKMKERIAHLESELKTSLTKKDSATAEIDVPSQMRKINDLRIELNKLLNK